MGTGKLSRRLRRYFRPFLTHREKIAVAAAVAQAEAQTSVQIEVQVIARTKNRDILEIAKQRSEKNTVLLLISHLDHRFAIWAGENLSVKISDAQWHSALAVLKQHFQARHYAKGIQACVQEIGRIAAATFPPKISNNAS